MLLVAAAVVALHMAVASRYGYFRDELYYIAAAHHLAAGYFDFPAGVALVTWVVGHTLGYRLWALHLPPALAHAGLVLVSAAVAGELGADAYARYLAALVTAVAPAFLGSGSILTMDIFDELFWALGGWAAVVALRRDRPRRWLLFGLAGAAGLVFKLSMLFFGAALLIGLLLSQVGRRHLRTPWPWLAGAIAAVGLVPYAAWEVAHGWPTLAFYAHYRAAQAQGGPGPGSFAEQQILLTSVLSAPVWIWGWCWTLFGRGAEPLRALGWAYALLLVLFGATHAKVYFLTPLYPLLFGVGAARVSGWIRRGWTRGAYAALVVAGAAALAPVVMPILPPAAAARYAAPLHVGEGADPLIQPLADRFGWPQQVAVVAEVWADLPSADRARACILTANYGEAAAIDFFGPAYGLPPAISGHNQYYLWGSRGCTGEVLVTVGVPQAFLRQKFGEVTPVATTACRFCVPEEDGAPIDVSRNPRIGLTTDWAAWLSIG